MVATRLQNGLHVPYSADGIDHWHKAPRQSDPRRRTQIKFWVDLNKEVGEWAVDTMAALKLERKFKETMLSGFRLMIDLRHKKIDYLFELFPWVEAWMDTQVEAEVSRRVALAQQEQSAGQGDLEKRLAKLEALLVEMDAPAPVALKPVAPANDTLLTIAKAAPSQDTASSSNFLSSAFNLQS